MSDAFYCFVSMQNSVSSAVAAFRIETAMYILIHVMQGNYHTYEEVSKPWDLAYVCLSLDAT